MSCVSKLVAVFPLVFATTINVIAQQSIASYTVGSVFGTTPFVTVSTAGTNPASIGINEYSISHFDELKSRALIFNRKGIGSITRTASKEKTVFKVVLKDSRWEVIEVAFESAPEIISAEMTGEFAMRSSSKISSDNGSVLISTGIPKKQSTVLVLEGGDLDISCNAISQVVKGAMVERFELLDRNDLQRLIEEQKLSLSGIVSEEASIEAGRIYGAQYASRMSCTGLDGQYLVTIEFINCETSAIEGVLTVSSSNIAGVSQLIWAELGKD